MSIERVRSSQDLEGTVVLRLELKRTVCVCAVHYVLRLHCSFCKKERKKEKIVSFFLFIHIFYSSAEILHTHISHCMGSTTLLVGEPTPCSCCHRRVNSLIGLGHFVRARGREDEITLLPTLLERCLTPSEAWLSGTQSSYCTTHVRFSARPHLHLLFTLGL